MESLNDHIREYTNQLKKGQIQKAYKGIIAFMSGLCTYLGKNHPDYSLSAMYSGYMDMTYFAFTPTDLKKKNLKIAIVYLHEQNKFEAWLGGSNRKVQALYIDRLSLKDTGKYIVSHVSPGVDSIIESTLVELPDFDDSDKLRKLIEMAIIEFINDMITLLF
ncbi:MAG: hypothetical protein WCY62_02550 [Clostridia bacterium]